MPHESHAKPAADAGLSRVMTRLELPASVNRNRFQSVYFYALLTMHLLALAAFIPWLFNWYAVGFFIFGIYFFGQGINLCYHRVLTHRSVELPLWLEHFWTLIALCCMEDTPGKWVTTHRHHHKHSDEQEDPHTPLVTFWWSHFQWLTLHNSDTHSIDAFQKYSKDILSDPFYMKLEKNKWLSPAIYLTHAAMIIALGAIIGWFTGGTTAAMVQGGLSFLVWGVILRTVAVWHITWSVNSLTHTWGYRNYTTDDRSRNNWLVAVLASGEGWHNNHHHDQASASNQHHWWELDLTYYHIVLLKWLGLAKHVIAPKHVRHALNAKARATAAPAVQAPATPDEHDATAPVSGVQQSNRI